MTKLEGKKGKKIIEWEYQMVKSMSNAEVIKCKGQTIHLIWIEIAVPLEICVKCDIQNMHTSYDNAENKEKKSMKIVNLFGEHIVNRTIDRMIGDNW